MKLTPKQEFILKCTNCGKEYILNESYWTNDWNKSINIFADYDGEITIKCDCGNEINL